MIFLIVSLAISLVSFSRCDPTTTGLTLELYHVDSSPMSPFYDPLLTPSQRLANAIRRSINSLNLSTVSGATDQSAAATDPAPVITNSGGDYLLSYSIGTPPKSTQGYVSTANDLIWTLCSDIRGSSSDDPVKCNTQECSSYLPGLTSCSKRKKTCHYQTRSADGSDSMGGLTRDNIILPSASGKSVSVNMVFGCDLKQQGPGYVGLGRGKASLVQQLQQSQFSHCLVPASSQPRLSSSKLNFGGNAGVQGGQSTPLISGLSPRFYYVKLSGISIGTDRLNIYKNMILNTGTTLTMLPDPFYTRLMRAVKQQLKVKTFPDRKLQGLECFFPSKTTEFPRVTVHLQGVNLVLERDNLFARMSKTKWCLAVGLASGEPIYGSLAMANFLVGVDLKANEVKFKKADCTKH